MICSRFSTFMQDHAIANIMVDLNFDSRTFVYCRYLKDLLIQSIVFFSHVGIEHASAEFRILNAWFYMYTIKRFLHRKALIYSQLD